MLSISVNMRDNRIFPGNGIRPASVSNESVNFKRGGLEFRT